MSSVKKKLLHLQGIRGVAILAVVAFHFFPKWCKNGYLGVDIFFLLSGYLMTMMLDRMDRIFLPEFADFWYRRMKRIVPFYYLATFGIIVILIFSNGMVQSANIDSALNAIFLATNLIRPDGLDGYFEKLGIAVDMFTHTWSLALEMQFYLIFPFIFVILKSLPTKLTPFIVFLTGFTSFAYHATSDDFTAFNSVFARIWQFMAGTAAFYAETWFSTNRSSDLDEKEEFISKVTEGTSRQSNDGFLLNIFVIALLSLLLVPQEVNPLYARMNSILLSFVIVAYGRSCCLENRFLVFIGEISYGWYLIHWPVFACLKTYEISEDYYLLSGILFSFLISIILHYSYERFYLTWSKQIIFYVVFFLLLCNGLGIAYLKHSAVKEDVSFKAASENYTNLEMTKNLDTNFFYPSDFMENVVYGFENMTAEERIKLNEEYDSGDGARSKQYCKQFVKTIISKEMRCVLNYNVNSSANSSILIIGNSWAGNLMQPVAESCSHRFSNMVTVFQSGCNPLFPSDQHDSYSCHLDYMFLDAIKEMKPDVLMMLVRYSYDAYEFVNGTSPVNDWRYKEAAVRLKKWQKYVKKKIIILDAFPWPKKSLISSMIKKLKGEDVPKEYYEVDNRYMIMKQRIARLTENCEKCRIIDFGIQFWFNGEFHLYEPKYSMSFMSTPFHLTPAGWVRVKPLLKHACESV